MACRNMVHRKHYTFQTGPLYILHRNISKSTHLSPKLGNTDWVNLQYFFLLTFCSMDHYFKALPYRCHNISTHFITGVKLWHLTYCNCDFNLHSVAWIIVSIIIVLIYIASRSHTEKHLQTGHSVSRDPGCGMICPTTFKQ